MSTVPREHPLTIMKPARVPRFRLQGIPSIDAATIKLQRVKTTCFDFTKSSKMPPEK